MLKRTFILIGLVLSFCSLPAQELIQITTRNTALVFRVANQSLRQVYYGPRLADTDVLQKQGNNFPAYSTYGMGEQNEVALHAVHADGNTSTLLNFENVKQESPEPGITLTTISLKDPLYPFQVKLFYKAYEESDLIEQWTIYQHTEKKSVTLYQFASAQLSFKSSSYRLTHFAGDWAGECNMSEVELTEGIKVIDSKLGTRATFFAHPMCLLSLNGRMTEDNGEVIGMALAWPANFKLEFEKNNNQELRVLAGMNPYASHYKLKKGDVFQTPSFLYTYSTKGNGQVSRNFHRWARKYGLRHGENSRYTLMNNWEATYFNFNEPKLKSIIEDAAGMGFELFLLDEPTNGLDITSRQALKRIISRSMDDESTLLISTHQAHDFENLLDHLVILGKGEILLNRSLDEISNRLLFARTDILPAESIYSEQDLSGHFSILPNEDGEENTPDIELLYKAVLQQPEKIQSMFQ